MGDAWNHANDCSLREGRRNRWEWGRGRAVPSSLYH